MTERSQPPETSLREQFAKHTAPNTRVLSQLADDFNSQEHGTQERFRPDLPLMTLNGHKEASSSGIIDKILHDALTPTDPLNSIDWSAARRHQGRDEQANSNVKTNDHDPNSDLPAQLVGAGTAGEADAEQADDQKRALHVVPLHFPNNQEQRFLTGAEIALGVMLVAGAVSKQRLASAEEVPAAPEKLEQSDKSDVKKKESEEEEDPVETKRRKFDREARRMAQQANLLKATYIVGPHDTLNDIAERLYDDARFGHLIADVNKLTINESFIDGKRIVQLYDRQTLTLPDRAQLRTFARCELSDIDASRLVTVVTRRETDRKMVATFLNRAMGIVEHATVARPLTQQILALQRQQSLALAGNCTIT